MKIPLTEISVSKYLDHEIVLERGQGATTCNDLHSRIGDTNCRDYYPPTPYRY